MNDDNSDDLIKVIADTCNKKERAYKSNEKGISGRKVLLKEVIQAVHTLQLYEKRVENQNFIIRLKKYNKLINTRTKSKQILIISYFIKEIKFDQLILKYLLAF